MNALNRRSVIFLLSDFISDNYETDFRMMAQKHDVIPIIIQDPVEKSIPQSGIVALEDAETGQTVLCDSSSKGFQSKIKSVLGSRKRQRERMFQSVGVKSISLSTNDDAIQPLQSFLNQDETVNLGFCNCVKFTFSCIASALCINIQRQCW